MPLQIIFLSKNGLFFQKVDTLTISKMVYFFIFGQKMYKRLLKVFEINI